MKKKQLLEKNKKLNNVLDTMQDKYSNILKKLVIVQIEVLKAQKSLTYKLNHQRQQKTSIESKDVKPMIVNQKK